jgi:hypothetical protein
MACCIKLFLYLNMMTHKLICVIEKKKAHSNGINGNKQQREQLTRAARYRIALLATGKYTIATLQPPHHHAPLSLCNLHIITSQALLPLHIIHYHHWTTY